MAKKLLAFLLTFALLLSTVTSAVMVLSAEAAVWDGTVATAFAGGSGTEADPYLIATPEQLARMVKNGDTAGGYYKLTADIYLNDVTKADWKTDSPNSWYDRAVINKVAFVGNFNGAGHTIHGLYYNGSDIAGLFPQASNTTVSNLRISNADITSASSVAALISFGQNTVTFKKCIIDETVKLATTGSGKGVAGFIGYGSPKIYIYDSAVMATIAAPDYAASFMGNVWGNTAAERVINDSFTTVNLPLLAHPSQGFTVENVYTVGTELPKQAITGTVNKLDSADMMKSTQAKTNMTDLNWKAVWQTTENGYPIHRDPDGIKGEVWTGAVADNFAGGSGTEADPYLIATPEQLAKMLFFGTTTTGQYYKLTADIYLNDVTKADWKTDSPNSWYDRAAINKVAFVGNIDGTGHTIHGLYYNGTNMFGLLPQASESSISNLRISNSDITSTSGIAAFVSFGQVKINFSKCVVDETVTITGTGDTAGFIAYGTPAIYIDSSASTANISGGTNVGALVGDCWYGKNTASDGSTVYTKHVINNSYGMDHPLDAKYNFTASNCYNTVAETKTFTAGEVVNLGDKTLMQGADALKNMPLLTGFGTTDSYPVIYQQGTKGAVWSGSVAAEYAGGSGTKAAPYLIETAEQLAKLVKNGSGEGTYFAITDDIALNDTSASDWAVNSPKSWYSYNGTAATVISAGFAGTIDGQGHSISGIYYNGNGFAGLFPAVSKTTVFKNITIEDSSITITGSTINDNSAGAFVANASGAVTFDNCRVEESVVLDSDKSASGYVGYGTASVSVKDSVMLGSITATRRPGAFIADVWSGTITVSNSFAQGIAFTGNRGITSTNSYNTVADTYGTNVVTAEQMQGMTALENMPLLTGYFATEGYPVRYNDGVAGAVWSGGIASAFASGDGTKENPYVIKTGEQLARMITVSSNTVCFKLGADIVLGDENESHNWLDSSKSAIFAGNFNGNGYIISGLYYDADAAGSVYAGLIPVADGAYVSNVILEDSGINMLTNTDQATYVGGIVGYITGETKLYSCYVAESVTLRNIADEGVATKRNSVGGLLGGGSAKAFTIDGCAFFGTLDGFDYRYGAVFGDVWGAIEATRTVKYTMVDKYVPSSRWGFSGSHNVSTVAPALIGGTSTDVDESFTVAETLKGEEGFKAANTANWNGRYFGTENYPVLSALGKRFGDVNGDRICDSSDLVMLRKNLIGASVLGYIDVNGDGENSIKDLVSLKKKLSAASGKDGYELVWSDEFTGTALDETKWNISQTRMHDTKELAWTDLSSVRSVSDGNLQLNAMKNQWYQEGTDDYFASRPYMTTGSVTTENKMSFQYGYLEIRAKVPYKEGCWPSFWLRSHHATGKQVNPDFEVEVDVFEVFGNKTSMASNLHQQGYNGQSYMTTKDPINSEEVHTFENAADLSQEYHTYAFEWEPDKMAVYVDGALQCKWDLNRWSLYSYGLKPNTSGFDTTMNILFNNHLFTKTSEYKPSDDNIIENYEGNLPAEFDIDYVRLYQKNDGISKLILGE